MKKLLPVLASAGRVLALAVSMALVAYVLYVQVQKQSVGREYVYGGFDDHFTVGTGSFAFVSNHVDVWNTAGDVTLVTADGQPSDVRFRGRAQHLEAGTFRIRYRIEEPGPVEIFCGVEKSEGEPRALEFSVVHDGDQAAGLSYRLQGDGTSTGAAEKLDVRAPNGANLMTLDDSAGSHEIALRLFPLGKATVGEVDSRSVMTKAVHWEPGTPYRMVFGVRSAQKRARVHIELAAFEPEERWELSSFEEKFDGKLVNPRRFQVLPADPFAAETRTAMVPGGGLSIFAKTKVWKDVFPALVVRTKRVPLHGFRFRTTVSIEKMHHAAFFVGVAAASHMVQVPRAFDIGFIDEPTFHGPFITGHPLNADAFLYDPRRELQGRTSGVLELRYNSETGIGEAILDGVMLRDMPLDLMPLDEVTFRFGINMQADDGELSAIVKEMSFDSKD